MNVLIKSVKGARMKAWQMWQQQLTCVAPPGSLNCSLQEHGGALGDGDAVWCGIASELHEIGVFPGVKFKET